MPNDFLSLIDVKKSGDASNSTYLSQSSATFPGDTDKVNTF